MKSSSTPARASNTTPDQRAELLDAFDRSGLATAAFARQHGIRWGLLTYGGVARRGVSFGMIEAFIFDIDGTLIDSNDFHAKSWQRAFAEHGKEISFEQIRPHLGKGGDQLLPEFLSKEEIEKLGKAITASKDEIFKRDYLPRVQPFPQVRELFEKIRAAGRRIALASSSKEEEVKKFKAIAQIDDLVEKTTSADDAKESKPEPDIFHSAMKLLGNPSHDKVLVIGDTPYDAMAAVKARLPIIGVLCGGFSDHVLKATGCRALYRDPADLLKHLDEILSGKF